MKISSFSTLAVFSLIVLISFISQTNVSADTTVKTKTYKVYGKTAEALQLSLRKNGPNGFAALTTARTNTNYNVETLKGVATLKDLDIDVQIVKTMPKWVDYNEASKCMRKSWDLMYKNLLRHENIHVEKYKKVEGQVKRKLKSMGTKKSFSSVKRNVKRRVAEVTNRIHNENRDFDKRTQHGLRDPKFPVSFAFCKR